MKKKYQHIFFDLDHTLWDFEKNSSEALEELFYTYELGYHKLFTLDEFIATFQAVNYKLWSDYDLDIIDRNNIREQRFLKIFEELGIEQPSFTTEISEAYLRLCPTKKNILPYTTEILDYLKGRYHLHIITNGFTDIQHMKLQSAGLSAYFSEVITSDSCGFKKPHKNVFNYALQKVAASCMDCLMIGDNLTTDILGAKAVNMDHVYYNPAGKSHKEDITYEIRCLSDLKKIL